MNRIERLSKSIASKISSSLGIDSDHEEVLAYGAFALIQTLISILAVAVFGILFGVLAEALIISFSAAILRKFSGGVHASTPVSCALIGMIIFGGLALFVKYFLINVKFLYLAVFMFIVFVFVFFVMFKYSPVGCENKPLKNANTRKRLKKQSLIFTSAMLVLNIFLISLFLITGNIYFLSFAICILTGILWQSITLVSLGNMIIENLDKVLGGTILIRRTS